MASARFQCLSSRSLRAALLGALSAMLVAACGGGNDTVANSGSISPLADGGAAMDGGLVVDAGPAPDGGAAADGGPACAAREALPPGGDQRGAFAAALGLSLGRGFSSLTSSVAGACMVTPPTTPTVVAGDRQADFRIVEEATSYRRSQSLSAGASFGYGVYSGSADMRMLNSESLDSSSIVLDLRVSIEYGEEQLPTLELRPDALRLLAEDPQGFAERCGDQFVSAMRRGARFRVLYQFFGLTTQSRRELSASFNASGANWSANAAFATALSQATSRYEYRLFQEESGGALAPLSLSPAQIIASAQSFGLDPNVPYTQRAVLRVATQPYTQASNWPVSARFPPIREQMRILESAADFYDQALVLRNDIRDRLSRGGRLQTAPCAATKARLEDKVAALEAYRRAVRARVDACQNFDLCGASADCRREPPAPELQMPAIEEACGPYCTDGRNSWSKTDPQGYCTRCRWAPALYNTQTSGGADRVAVARCDFMRPGARVSIRAGGRYYARAPQDGTSPWIQFSLSGATGPSTDTGTCGAACSFNVANMTNFPVNGNTAGFGAEYQDRVLPGGTLPHYYESIVSQSRCGSSTNAGCTYEDVSFDICDFDSEDCGAPFPRPDGGP